MRPWKLLEANYGDIKNMQFEVAVLPFGATEPHNLHLPYGTDYFEGTIVGEHLCEAAYAQGAKVVLLPTIPYGTETNLREFPLAMNLNPTTVLAIMRDLVESCIDSGIRKIVLLNSHGGNGLKPFLRELSGKVDAHLFLLEWYRAFTDVYDTIFDAPEDHAGEMETSFGLAYFPDLIRMKPDGSLDADEGATAPTRFPAINEGWVSITRPWHLLTTNAGSGNPHQASAEKGRRMMEVLKERIVPFLVELSQSPIDERFPY